MTTRHKFRLLLNSLVISGFIVPGLYAQDTIEQYNVVDTIPFNLALFDDEEPASISLIYDVKDFIKNRNKDKYVRARLVYQFDDTLNITREIRIKARGKNRREVCQFPPLWINIREADFNSPYLEDINRIKLVTYCAKSRENMDYVLKEYLVYKLYNIVSPYSFRVRLVKVRYIDTGRKNAEFDSWGFLIEPEEMMAHRLDADPVKRDYIGYRITDPRETDIMSMFQYIIGNADYSILSRQNVKLIMLNDSSHKIIPVPYDFDYAGFVDAHYATPGEDLGLTSVRERYFLGPCRSDETYRQIFDHFFDRKEEVYHFLNSFKYLDEKTKSTGIRYLDEFYLSRPDSKYIKKNLKRTCRESDIQNY